MTATRPVVVTVASPSAALANTLDTPAWKTLPAGNCTAVFAQSPTSQLFGFQNGDLYYSTDGLTTMADLLHTFDSAVVAIYANPYLDWRFTVGLANGAIWRSFDSGTNWWPIYECSARPMRIFETPQADQTYVATGNQIVAIDGRQVVLEAPDAIHTFLLDVAGIFAGSERHIVGADGSSWASPSAIVGLFSAPGGGDSRLAAAASGQLYTQTGPSTWSSSGTPAPGGITDCVLLHGRVLLAAGAQWLNVSADLGTHWYQLRRGVFTAISCAIASETT